MPEKPQFTGFLAIPKKLKSTCFAPDTATMCISPANNKFEFYFIQLTFLSTAFIKGSTIRLAGFWREIYK